jgi:hypothetical protein
MQLNSGEVRNKLFLNPKEDGRTACFLAAKSGNVEIVEEIWGFPKQKGNPKEIKSKFLLHKTKTGRLLCTWQQKAVWRYWRNCGILLKKIKSKTSNIRNCY